MTHLVTYTLRCPDCGAAIATPLHIDPYTGGVELCTDGAEHFVLEHVKLNPEIHPTFKTGGEL